MAEAKILVRFFAYITLKLNMTLAVVDAFSKLVDVVAYVGEEENNDNR